MSNSTFSLTSDQYGGGWLTRSSGHFIRREWPITNCVERS